MLGALHMRFTIHGRDIEVSTLNELVRAALAAGINPGCLLEQLDQPHGTSIQRG
jgi:hypothetical protein